MWCYKESCDRVALHLPGQTAASLETIHQGKFLGYSFCLYLGLAACDAQKSPGSCVMRLKRQHRGTYHGSQIDRACLPMRCGLTWDFVGPHWVVRARVPFCVSNTASCRLIDEGLCPLGGQHKPDFFHLDTHTSELV
jgi:hypothetical protein